MSLAAGSSLGPYEILSALGAGGMGEVYRARDSRLGRDVAVKVLPDHLASDAVAMTRFQREARSAAALSHPNIVSVFDVGMANGVPWVAMELLDGETLRRKLAAGAFPLRKALGYASQIAMGLAAAHAKGIVHRDLKPENLFIGRDGTVKILDFGLARLTQPEAPPGHLETEPTETALTGAGAVLGTTGYMAPEQVRGLPADHRADIFAFGCVLYEMLVGRRAFHAATSADTLSEILHAEPSEMGTLAKTVPALERVVRHCLEKEPDDRFQSMRDLVFALEAPAEPDGKPVPRPGPEPRPARLLGQVGGALLLATTLVGLGLWLGARSRGLGAGAGSTARLSVRPLTVGPGYEAEPTFSPDGQTIAYVSDRTGNLEIYLKQVSGGPDINLTNNPADDVQPAFSPDGREIAFVSTRSSASDLIYRAPRLPLMGGDVWVMAALGGSARKVAEGGNFPSWTPDGSALVYVAGPWFGSKLFRVPAQGGKPQEIPIDWAPDEPPWEFLLYPSISPDGRWLAFASPRAIYVMPSQGGRASRLILGTRPAWMPDGRSIVYCGDESGGSQSLWRLPFDPRKGTVGGEPVPLTIGRGRDTQAAPSRDGRRIAFAAQDVTTELQATPFDAEAGTLRGEPRTLTSGRQFIAFFSPSPDGSSVAYEAIRGDGNHIWRVDAGSRPVQLTNDAAFDDGAPHWSPDAARIAFTRRLVKGSQRAELWLMGADGSDPRRLLAEGGSPRWVPNGRSLLFHKAGALWRLDVASSAVTKVETGARVMPIYDVSADGVWIAAQTVTKGDVDILAAPLPGGAVRTVVATPKEDYHPFFSPSGSWLYFEPDHKNIYRVPGPAQGWRQAKPEKVTSFPESNLYHEDPHLSRDGAQLFYTRVRVSSTLWLLSFGE